MNQHSTSAARRAPVTERGRQARLKLLRAAEEVFGEKGYEEASIAEICRTAGAALGSFYVYFADKKAAFVELVDLLGHRVRQELAAAIAGQPDRLAQERAGLVAFFQFVAKHKKLYRIVRQAEFVDDAAFRRYYARLAAGYAKGLGAAMDRDEVRRLDPEIASYCLMGMGDFLGMRWVLWQDGSLADAERVADVAMSFIANGLALPPKSPPRKQRPARAREAS
ncbi:MAG: TetR/AcrR family transcriptional regulator [Labilithrix sp.]|nr:TetR/AcrR family transcriptional regulator [Labilithrix sp.]